jgi:hypothetical protein
MGTRPDRCPHSFNVAARHARPAIGGHSTDLDDVFDMWLVSRAAGPPHHITYMGGTGHHGSSRSRFSEVREPPEKGSNRLETASMRNARTSYPVEPQSRRPHATMATFSRTFIVLTRSIQWRMSSPPHIVTERKQADNRPPHTSDVGTGHKADRAGYKPAMTSAVMTYPMCDAGPA